MGLHLSALKHVLNYELRYNISREYPDRRIKWVALVLFIFLLGLITTFNLATTGYDLQPFITVDPNTTEKQRHWYHNKIFTWGDDKLEPRCQSQDLAIGSQFMTTNEGLQYTIRKIFTSADDGYGRMDYFPSVQYLNNTLENCRVNSISIFLRKVDDSSPGAGQSSWWSWISSTASASAQCTVLNPTGNYSIMFDAIFPGESKNFDYVAVNTPMTHASIWWGTRISDNYFQGIEVVMSTGTNETDASQIIYTYGRLDFSIKDIHTIQEYRFFTPVFSFNSPQGQITVNDNVHVDEEHLYNNIQVSLSRAITESSAFSKVFYSMILVDLGQDKVPNLLLDEDLLQYILAPPDNFNRLEGGPLNSTDAFDWWKS